MRKKLLSKISLLIFIFSLLNSALFSQMVVNVPTSGAGTTIPAGETALVYDDGGAMGNYTNNCNGYVYIAASPGQRITITGSYETENWSTNADAIRIYSGEGTGGTVRSGPLRGSVTWYTYTGNVGEGLSIHFISDGSTVYTGFKFLVTYSSLPTLNVPTLVANANSVPCETNTLLFDSGGRGSSPGNNQTGYTVLNADGGGQIRLLGTYYTESGYDYVEIFAGTGTSGTLLMSYSGNMNTNTANRVIDYTGAVGQTLTVRYRSDGGVNYNGFELAAIWIAPCCTTPIVYTVGGGGSCVASGTITLNNSQTDVNYQLKRNGVNQGGVVPGNTGSTLSWTNQTGGTYTIEAIGTNSYCAGPTAMSGSVSITTAPIISGPSTACVSTTIDLNATGEWSSLPTGGTITPHGNERMHVFNASNATGFGTTQPIFAKVLVVAGGGGGGGRHAGGGGGGGVLFEPSYLISSGSHSVTVGTGGTAGATGTGNQGGNGGKGGNSTFLTFTAEGGGYGAGNENGHAGSGGSGGGGCNRHDATAGNGGSGVAGQGNSGGNITANIGFGAGGGGADQAAGSSGTVGTAGGNGRNLSSHFGTGVGVSGIFGGGGGGGSNTATFYSGGLGGGAQGGNNVAATKNGLAGTVNTGGGGGGGGALSGTANATNNGAGGAGGSGVVIIRYIVPRWQVVSTTGAATATFNDDLTGELNVGPGIGTVTVRYTNEFGCSEESTIAIGLLAPVVAGNITVGPVTGANGTPLLPDANITPVDYLGHEAYRGRLFNMGPGVQGWASLTGHEWTVDLGSVKPVNGVITQGRAALDYCCQWTTEYEVQISQNGTNWVSMGLFNGNTDTETPVTNMFASVTTTARYVKILPKQWNGYYTMRIDVISIPSACSSGTQAVSMSGEPALGANTLRWYSAASGGTPLHTGQYYTANISSTTNFYAASYNSVTGCESTARTLVTARIGVSEGTPPAATASIPTHVTNFSSTTPATGWITSHGMAGHLPVGGTNTSTHDCSGDAAPMNERGHYIWTRYNSNANRLSYTLKLNPGSVPDPHRTLLIEESVDGCVWTPVVIHTNTALLTNNTIQSFVQNLNPSSRHVRFNLTRRDTNAGKIEVDNVMIYNNTPSFPTALSGNKNQTCQVYGQHWVDFFADDNTYIGSVRANGTTPTSNSLGNVTLTSFTGAPGTAPVCGETTNIIYQTAYLGRNWVITSTIAPTVDVSVRMPFYDSELGALSNTATTVTTGNPDDDVSVRTDLMLTKYSGTNEDNILTNNVCTPGAYTIYDTQEGDGLVNSIFTAMGSNSQYVVFNIPSFSELWLHGSNATIPSPLPIILSDFSASCKNRKITWATASEQNSSHFVVEQSRDGYEWSEIATVEGAGTKSTVTNYEVSNNLSASYYRLKQVDFDGKTEYFGPIHVDCGNSNTTLTVYPNPNSGTFTVSISSTEELGESALLIHDVSGKEVAVRNINVLSGINTVYFENNDLMPGTYIVSVRGKEKNTLTPVRLVVQ